MKLEEPRRVQCKQCKHTWMSKVDAPRCSKCGTRKVAKVKMMRIPIPSTEPLKLEKLNETIEKLEERVTTLRNRMSDLETLIGNLEETFMEGDFQLVLKPKRR